MLSRLRGRRVRGFTLIELLIVVAIIGIIAALLIPNFLDALQKAKQKRAVADIRNTGTAMFSWLTDQVGAASAGATFNAGLYGSARVTSTQLASYLVSQYVQAVPANDAWGTPYEYALRTANPLAANVMFIASYGRNKAFENSGVVPFGAFDPTDYDQDILWADGFFVRWPQKGT